MQLGSEPLGWRPPGGGGGLRSCPVLATLPHGRLKQSFVCSPGCGAPAFLPKMRSQENTNSKAGHMVHTAPPLSHHPWIHPLGASPQFVITRLLAPCRVGSLSPSHPCPPPPQQAGFLLCLTLQHLTKPHLAQSPAPSLGHTEWARGIVTEQNVSIGFRSSRRVLVSEFFFFVFYFWHFKPRGSWTAIQGGAHKFIFIVL